MHRNNAFKLLRKKLSFQNESKIKSISDTNDYFGQQYFGMLYMKIYFGKKEYYLEKKKWDARSIFKMDKYVGKYKQTLDNTN